MFFRFRSVLAVLAFLLAPVLQARTFELRRDAFAFSNDTVFSYGVDEQGVLHIDPRKKPAEFSHSCFILARATLQFWNFVRFAPEQPKVSRDKYRELILTVCRIPVWSAGPRTPIVIPGFADLHDFSAAYEGLLKENLGRWLPTYFRIGNWRMMMGHPRAGQAALARWLVTADVPEHPRAVFLTRFPWMNHVVIVYGVKPKNAAGDLRFTVYDPNYPSQASWIDYEAAARSFAFQKRWYFPGGRVNLLRVYISPFQ